MRQLKITQSITNRRESHTLEKYFTEVSGVPMITPEEEVRLAKEIKKGNQDALDKLVRANLRFVVSCEPSILLFKATIFSPEGEMSNDE